MDGSIQDCIPVCLLHISSVCCNRGKICFVYLLRTLLASSFTIEKRAEFSHGALVLPLKALRLHTDIKRGEKEPRRQRALTTSLSAMQDKLTSLYIKYLVFSFSFFSLFRKPPSLLVCHVNRICDAVSGVSRMFIFVMTPFIHAPGTKKNTDCSHICVSGPCIIQRLVLGDIIIRT